jgi:hypothetical protein
MKKLMTILCLIFLFSTLVAGAARAAGPLPQADGEEYTVQADDWLSKLAEKSFGDVLAWPVIWKATNNKAAEDDSFASIPDPNIIEVGWKLWIPSEAEASTLLEEFAAERSATTVTVRPILPANSACCAWSMCNGARAWSRNSTSCSPVSSSTGCGCPAANR